MIDVKKLITGFLILVVAASCSTLILANIGASSASLPAATTTPTSTATALGPNAFSPNSPGQAALGSDDGQATSSNPNNLTESIADAFATNIAAANQSGLQKDASGNAQLSNPDLQAVLDAVATGTAAKNIKIPDWNNEVNVLDAEIKTGASSTDAILSYLNASIDIANSHLVKPNIERTLSDAYGSGNANQEISAIAIARPAVATTLSDITSLVVPPQLVPLQKKLIKVLVYEKNTALLTESPSGDPAMAAIILQSKQSEYDQALQDFNNELQKSVSAKLFSENTAPKPETVFAFIGELLIPKAHAVVGVPVSDYGLYTMMTTNNTLAAGGNAISIGNFIEKVAMDAALQIVKNALISVIQQKVMRWIQGAGLPGFVTNVLTMTTQAFQASALNALDAQMQCVPTFYMPQLRMQLNLFYGSGNNCASNFQSFLNSPNFKRFSTNFMSGSWVSFGQSLLPTGNYYGGLFFTAQAVQNSANGTKQSQIAQYTAGQGMSPDAKCSDGSNPNGTNSYCYDPKTGAKSNSSFGICMTGTTKITNPNGGICSSGGTPNVTTPGGLKALAFGSAQDSGPKLIIGGTSIGGLAAALISSIINSLAQSAITAANQTVNGFLAGGNNSGGILAVNPDSLSNSQASSTSPALACSPASSTALIGAQTALTAMGGTFDVNGNLPTYNWLSSDGQSATNSQQFAPTFNATGTYVISLTDSMGDPTSTCSVDVQSSQ